MSTPTPQTDSEEYPEGEGQSFHVVSADFARTLERELAAAQQEAAHYMSVAQKATDELARLRADNLTAHQMACAAGLERDQLRAEVKRWQAEAEEMSAQRSHNANQAGRLRAELVVEKNWVEHHSQHADDLIGENVKLRADLERFTGHGLLDCHAICDQRDAAIARAERAEAEILERAAMMRDVMLERDKAEAALAEAVDGEINGGSIFEKLLVVHIPRLPVGYRVGHPVKVILPAIDAAMKEGSK